MIKKLLLTTAYAIVGMTSVLAQVNGGGTPLSLDKFAPIELTQSTFQISDVGSISKSMVEEEDAINDSLEKPYRVGINLNVNLTTLNSGTWTNLPDGRKVWRLGIKSKGAKAIGLYFFQDLHIPIGAKLFAYNADKTQIIGSFDHKTPSFAAMQMIEGETLLLEYIAENNVNDLPIIPINQVVHFYRGVEDFIAPFKKEPTATEKAENCQIDVVCSEGNLWGDQIRSVVHYTFTQGASTYVCSASTVNNTALDCKPYILSAWHCGEPTAGSDISTWVWYWKYQKTTCQPGTGNGTDPSKGSLTMTGGTVRASSGNGTLNNPPGTNELAGSDFYLVELGSQPPSTYEVYYAGWDRTNTGATSGVGIHHPAGSAKKISTYTSALTSTTYNGGAANAHWRVVWAATANGHGVTEGGSSGSPIFNQNGRVVGQLSGGSSYCNALTDPDLYGKFYTNWDLNGTTTNAQLKPWLDPGNTGLTVLDGSSYPCSGVVADFTAPQTVCAGSSVQFTNTSTGNPVPNSWSWTFSGGTPSTSTDQNPLITYSTPGTYDVTLTASNGTNNDTETKTGYITVVASTSQALPLVEGFTNTTFPPTNWTIVNVNANGTWARHGTAGTAPSGNGSMYFNNYNIDDRGYTDETRTPKLDFSGLASAALTFDVAYAPYDATYYDGLEVLISTNCGGSFTSVYSKSNTTLATAVATTNSFVPTSTQWRNESIDLTAYIGQPGVMIAFRNLGGYGNNIYVDNVNISGVAASTPPTASFTGTPTTVCAGQSVTYTNTSTGSPTSYSWVFEGGTPAISTDVSPVVTYAVAGMYDVALTATNSYGSNTSTQTDYITVNSAPATPGTISGATTLCSGSSGNIYSISAVSGATSYTWSVPAGATITAGQGTISATVTFGSTSGDVSVTASNTCGTSSAATLAVTVNSAPVTPGAITGTTTLCSGSSGNIYSISAVSGATSYTWSVPAGATITAGQGTTAVTVTFGSTSGNVSVTASNTCGTSSASSLAVTVNSIPVTPGAISGSTIACEGSAGNIYSISAVSEATSYTWSVPVGATITAGQGTTSATVTFGSTSGDVSVTASNACGTSSAAVLAVTLSSAAPATPGAISGSISVCEGSTGNTYTISAVTSATSYTWSVPTGATITAGQGTTSVTVTFGSLTGDLSVVASSSCGTSSASTQSITVNQIPTEPTLTVSDNCGNSVLSATGSNLLWSTTETASSITVITSGVYTVTQTVNGCVSDAASISASPLTIPTVTFDLLADVCINTPAFDLTEGSPAGGTYSGTGVTSSQFDPAVAGYGTFTLTYTYVDANGCTDFDEQTITVGCASVIEEQIVGLSIYPNPTSGNFTVKVENDLLEKITVCDYSGRIVKVMSDLKAINVIDMASNSEGVYTLIIETVNNTYKEKIVLIK